MELSGFSHFHDKALLKLAEESLFSQPLSTTCQYEVLAGASGRSEVRLLTHRAHFLNMNSHFGLKRQYTGKEVC